MKSRGLESSWIKQVSRGLYLVLTSSYMLCDLFLLFKKWRIFATRFCHHDVPSKHEKHFETTRQTNFLLVTVSVKCFGNMDK